MSIRICSLTCRAREALRQAGRNFAGIPRVTLSAGVRGPLRRCVRRGSQVAED
jgi:hypothetical protein